MADPLPIYRLGTAHLFSDHPSTPSEQAVIDIKILNVAEINNLKLSEKALISNLD